MDPADLEQFVDRELKRLPLPRAPRTLLPRVLRAVRQQIARPWYERAWLSWPRGWQALSLVMFVALCAGIAMLRAIVPAFNDMGPTWVLDAVSRLGEVARRVDTAMSAIAVLRRVIVVPVWGYLAVMMLTMCAVCTAFGAALTRVALGGASQT